MTDHDLERISSHFPKAPRRPSRRKRWLKKAVLGGTAILTGAGAHQAGLLDFSPAHTAQLALAPNAATEQAPGDMVVRDAALLSPAEADAEARATPALVSAANFDPADYAALSGRVVQQGEASFYGDEFAGRKTANGETFDPQAWTAAHRTLPLGSVVRVTNLDNGASIVLRINDRGPYAKDRVLDVSEAAAGVLGMEHTGTAKVRVEVL